MCASLQPRTPRSVIGISIGCLLGMIPLVFIDTTHRELWEIFTEVDTEGDSTISLDSVIKTVNVIGNRIVDEVGTNSCHGTRWRPPLPVWLCAALLRDVAASGSTLQRVNACM